MNMQEQTERMTRVGEQNAAQALDFSRAAVRSFERLARQNYAVMGDLVDFSLAQMRMTTTQTDPRTLAEAQSVQAKALADKARTRIGEYVEIASEMGQLGSRSSSPVTDSAVVTPAAGKPAVRPATQAAPKPAQAAPKSVAAASASAGGTPTKAAPKVVKRTAIASKPVAAKPVARTATRSAPKSTSKASAAKKKTAASGTPAKRRASKKG